MTSSLNAGLAAIGRGLESENPGLIERTVAELRQLVSLPLPRSRLLFFWISIGRGCEILYRGHGKPCGEESVRAYLTAARMSADAMLSDEQERETLTWCLHALVSMLPAAGVGDGVLTEVEDFTTDLSTLHADSQLHALLMFGLGAGRLRLAEDSPGRSGDARRALELLQSAAPDIEPAYGLALRQHQVQATILKASGAEELRRAVNEAFSVDQDPELAGVPDGHYRCQVVSALRKAARLNDGIDRWVPALRMRLWHAWAWQWLEDLEHSMSAGGPLTLEGPAWLGDLLSWETDSLTKHLTERTGTDLERLWGEADRLISEFTSWFGYPRHLLDLCLNMGISQAGITPPPRNRRSDAPATDASTDVRALIDDVLHGARQDPAAVADRLAEILVIADTSADRILVARVIYELLLRGVDHTMALECFRAAQAALAPVEASVEAAELCCALSDSAMNQAGPAGSWVRLSRDWAARALAMARRQREQSGDRSWTVIMLRCLGRLAYCEVVSQGRDSTKVQQWLDEADALASSLTSSDPETDWHRKYLAYIAALADGSPDRLLDATCELAECELEVTASERTDAAKIRAAIELVNLASIASDEARIRRFMQIRDAAQILLDCPDPPAYLREEMGHVLTLLSTGLLRDFAGLDARQAQRLADLSIRTARETSAAAMALLAKFSAHWQGSFNEDVSLADVLPVFKSCVQAGNTDVAIVLLNGWLTSRFNAPTVGGSRRFLEIEHRAARQLLAWSLAGRVDRELLLHVAYTVGETARIGDDYPTAEGWLTLVIDSIDPGKADEQAAGFRDAVINDRLSARLAYACTRGDRQGALATLRERLDRQDSGDGKIGMSGRLSNLAAYMSRFPARDVQDLVLSACAQADKMASPGEPLLLIDAAYAMTFLAAELADQSLLTQAERRVSSLLRSVPMSPELEASILRLRVKCRMGAALLKGLLASSFAG